MAEGPYPGESKKLLKDERGVSLDVRNLCYELNEVPYWDVGIAFGIKPSKLKSIQASSGPGSTEQQWKAEMFQHCLDNDHIQSWQDVVQALRKMDRAKLAIKIMQIADLPQSENAETQLNGNDKSLEDQAATALETENVCEITSRFTTLLMFTCFKLKQNNTNAEMFHLFVAGFFSVAAQCIPKSGDIVSMFDAISLNKLWDYWNWRPLKAVIQNFLHDDGDAKAKVREYYESIAAFQATTRISEFIKNQHGLLEHDMQPPPRKVARYDQSYYRTFRVKLKVDPTDLMLKYIDELWDSVCIQFSLPPLSVLLDRVKGNSISITWLFPTPLREQIIKISSHSEEFFQKNKITEVYVDDECVYIFGEYTNTSMNVKMSPFSEQSSLIFLQASSSTSEKTPTQEAVPSTSAMAKVASRKVSPPTSHWATQKPGTHAIQGYECEFINPPPRAFKTECPVCLQILRKPHEATCCGKVFCHTCISRVQEDSPCCPSCQSKQYQIHYSKNVEQSLKELYVRCENHKDGCQWTGELGQYDSHLNLHSQLEGRMGGCLYAKIPCCNGCGEAIPRHDILPHEMEECSQKRNDHTDLEKSMYLYIKRLTCEISQKDEQITELKSERLTSKKEVRPITPDPDESTTQKEASQRDQQISEPEHQFVTPKEAAQSTTPDPLELAAVIPVQRTVRNFTEMQERRREYISEPFYTHPGGYRMCLWVFPNGHGAAEDKYVSLFTCFMKGENDRKLKWPFRGIITVQLLDQVRGEDHRERTICYDDTNTSYARKLIIRERSEGWGVVRLISHESLYDASCPYLKDDCLKIRITKVEIDTTKAKQRKGFKSFFWTPKGPEKAEKAEGR